MSSKLSKKDLKGPDAFQSTFERLTDYVSANKTRVAVVATALCLAVVVVLGVYFYWNYYSSSALKLYAKAQQNMIQKGDNKETNEENIIIFNDLIKKYPYSWSGRMALYHLGNIHYNNADFDDAVEAYKKFLSKTRKDNTGIKFLALTSLGYAYEAKKDYEKALQAFEEAMDTYNVGFEMMGLRNIARTYEALNNKEKALEYYKKALDKTTEPSSIIFIKKKISALS